MPTVLGFMPRTDKKEKRKKENARNEKYNYLKIKVSHESLMKITVNT
jgi:hypothetical protein